MSNDSGDLPDYDQPPVVEVALAIQFQSAIGYRSLDLAKFAERWSDELPKVLEKPPLAPMPVDFDSPGIELKVSEETETPRLWLMDEEESRLVQLQQDRLVVNWRKRPRDAPYPHYDEIRDSLEKAWDKLEDVVKDLGRALPPPSICEVQYVNHFDEHSGWGSASDTPRVIAPWAGSMSDGFLPPPREAALSMLFALPDDRGWLVVDGRSGRQGPGGRLMTLNLIARGRAIAPDLRGALAFMDLAHEWIVRGFTSVTTGEAHERWLRKR